MTHVALAFFRFASIADLSTSSSLKILPRYLNSLTRAISSPPTSNTTFLELCSARCPWYRWYHLIYLFLCRYVTIHLDLFFQHAMTQIVWLLLRPPNTSSFIFAPIVKYYTALIRWFNNVHKISHRLGIDEWFYHPTFVSSPYHNKKECPYIALFFTTYNREQGLHLVATFGKTDDWLPLHLLAPLQ